MRVATLSYAASRLGMAGAGEISSSPDTTQAGAYGFMFGTSYVSRYVRYALSGGDHFLDMHLFCFFLPKKRFWRDSIFSCNRRLQESFSVCCLNNVP